MTLSYIMSPVDVVCETSVIFSKYRIFRFLIPKSSMTGSHSGLGNLTLAQELLISLLMVMPAFKVAFQPLVAG